MGQAMGGRSMPIWREGRQEDYNPGDFDQMKQPQEPSTEVLRRLDRIEGQLARLLDREI